ncbi:hypothetical protein [Aeromonas dhakensis]|uniref:hypothetical protein n=1 Tax=Aeromonas dhakensis TaxID=196024 RepID=UPI002B49FFB1|nr:hypothetical protein [Aeromonas dhakensis]
MKLACHYQVSLSHLLPNPAQAGFFDLPPPQNSAHTCFFTPILRLPNPALWRLYAGYSYHLVVNYTNGVDMNWLYLLLVLALAGYLMRALARTHE